MKTSTKLALASLKAGKIKSLLTGVAIFLTTALISIISFGGNALIQEQIANAAHNYGEHYGTFSHVTPEEIEKITLHSQFLNVGRQTYAGKAVCPNYSLNLRAADETAQMLAHIRPESGKMPMEEPEILAQREFFTALGAKNPQIGDSIEIPLRINGAGEIQTESFTISGFSPSSKANDLIKAYGAYVSEAFVKSRIPSKEQDVLLAFQIANEEKLNSDGMEEKIKELAASIGISEQQVFINDNYLLFSLTPNTEVILPCACILIVIMLISIMVIYNIFNVAVVQKIQEFGRLKAIGASKRQLKHMVRVEGILLCVPAIPSGILGGILVVKIWFHFGLGKDLSLFSLPLLLLIVALTLLTVLISMHKPMKLAAKSSPVESMRYEAGGGEQRRKGRENIRILSLTLSNLSLHRKRTATTILTMGLSCIFIVIIANIVGNMDGERQVREDLEHGRFRLELDYAFDDKAYPENNLYAIQQKEPFGADFIEKIKAIDGVTDVKARKLAQIYVTEKQNGKSSYEDLVIVDEEDFAWLKRNAERGTVDYKSLSEQDGVIYMWDHFLDQDYTLGESLKFEILDGNSKIPFTAPILGSCGHSNDAAFTMTEETYQKLGVKGDLTSILFVDCGTDAEQSVKKALESLTDQEDFPIRIKSYEDSSKLMDLQITFTRNGCYTFLIILCVIGFMNMANTMITNILTRKREFGVMQAIGMSNRQMNQMLQLEGLIFTVGTLLISLTLGNALGYLAYAKCKDIGMVGLFEYRLPILEITLLAVGLLLLEAALAFLLSRNVKKESIIERIRYEK